MTKRWLTLGLFIGVISLSGCSVSDFVAKYARSDVEKAAEAQLEQNTKIQQLVEKQKEFEASTQLQPIVTGASGAVFVYQRRLEGKTSLVLEGYMSKAAEGTYHLWLTNDEQNKFMDAGEIRHAEDEKVSLSYEIEADLEAMTSMVLSLETEVKDRPQKPMLAGKLIKRVIN